MPDLFSDPATLGLEVRLNSSFEAYVAKRAMASPAAPRTVRPLREQSADVYRDVWHSFVSFCAPREFTLETIDAVDIETFVIGLGDGEQVTPRYVRRVLALIARVTQFEASRNGTKVNPAASELRSRPRYRYADAALAEPPPEFLDARKSARLIAYVTATQPDPKLTVAWDWQEIRDRTAVALQLGAGITPGEVHGLTLDDIIIDGGNIAGLPWKLRLRANGNVPAHESPIAPWAGRQLSRWLKVRTLANIPGEWVFPSPRGGRPWSKVGCYNACQAVLKGAGIDSGEGGTYRLRHTYVLRQMANGKTELEIANWLGLQDPRSMERYRRVLAQPVVDII